MTFLANQWAAIAFSLLWVLGGEVPGITEFWQPAVIAVLYISGQIGTFSAITHGDVSIATPVFGVKVILVAFLVTVVGGETLPGAVWVAAFLATVGIAMVQWTGTGRGENRKLLLTILCAVGASTSFSLFDVLVQRFSPAWGGAGRILPVVFWFVAVFSLGFLPWFQKEKFQSPKLRTPLLIGALLIALQAICIVFTLSTFGDAARVNVVYATRGIWGVALAWLVAHRFGGSEADVGRAAMTLRLGGATLITLAVILAILS